MANNPLIQAPFAHPPKAETNIFQLLLQALCLVTLLFIIFFRAVGVVEFYNCLLYMNGCVERVDYVGRTENVALVSFCFEGCGLFINIAALDEPGESSLGEFPWRCRTLHGSESGRYRRSYCNQFGRMFSIETRLTVLTCLRIWSTGGSYAVCPTADG